jgi:hypothetical protein
MKKLLKATLFAALAMVGASSVAFAADSFGISGGFGSSVSVTGGSSATSGSNGNGYSYQASNSQGAGYAVGVTGLAVGYTGNAIGAGSFSGGVGGSATNASSYGVTGGDGYGATKSGAGVDYSSYGYGNVNGSYTY